MKKLEKLTLKELGNSTLVLSCAEEQRSIVAGSSGGYWITGDDGTQCYVESDDCYAFSEPAQTYQEWSDSHQTSTGNTIGKIVAGEIPAYGALQTYLDDRDSNEAWDTNSDLISAKVNGSDYIYVTGSAVYDSNGNVISSN